jgi:peroxiredoxin
VTSHRMAAACFVVGLLTSGCSDPRLETASQTKVKPDEQRKSAPGFALKDSDGRTVNLADYKGKVVMLNFWATWCGPCKIEIPWLIDFEQKYKDRGFAVVGISMDEEGWDAVKPYIQNSKINYRILLGTDTVAQSYGGVDSLPTTFLIDPAGKIASTHVGLVSKSDYENEIEHLLASAKRSDGGRAVIAARRAK